MKSRASYKLPQRVLFGVIGGIGCGLLLIPMGFGEGDWVAFLILPIVIVGYALGRYEGANTSGR